MYLLVDFAKPPTLLTHVCILQAMNPNSLQVSTWMLTVVGRFETEEALFRWLINCEKRTLCFESRIAPRSHLLPKDSTGAQSSEQHGKLYQVKQPDVSAIYSPGSSPRHNINGSWLPLDFQHPVLSLAKSFNIHLTHVCSIFEGSAQWRSTPP